MKRFSQIYKETQELDDLLSRAQDEKELLKTFGSYNTLTTKILDALPMSIFLEDRDGRTVFCNQQACTLNGMPLEELVGKTVYDFFPKSAADKNREDALDVWRTQKPLTKEQVVGFQGVESYMLTGKMIIELNDKENHEYLLGFGLDITDRVRAEKKLRESEERFRTLIDQAGDSLLLFDREGKIIDVNPMTCELLNYRKEELLLLNIKDIFTVFSEGIFSGTENIKNITRFEDQLITKKRYKVPVEINLRWVSIENENMYLALCRDIRDRKMAEKQIEHMAYHDALTGLPNRWYIQTYFNQFFSKKQCGNESLAIFLLDLDHFKVINDSLGHEAGDQLLKKVADRLKEATNKNDILARLGGDEFLLLTPYLLNKDEVHTVCETIIKVMERPFVIQNKKFNIKTSIGVSILPKDEKNINTLIKNADLALYQAKAQGRNGYSLFSPTMNEKAVQRMNQEILLREALETNKLLLHYQPKMNVKTGEIVGVEALLRWRRDDNELIYPDSFIHIAEETGLIVPIGEWVLRKACQQCKEWHDAGLDNLTVAVNISPKQFQRNNLERLIKNILEETQLPPYALEIELTESMIMDNPEEAALTLKKLKSIGITISIDDFGTGFSSLNYLKKFPINTLKIDRSFIMSLEKDEANSAIARAIISLAQSLNLSVVAEGVENHNHLSFLQGENCEFAQGYYISQPLDQEAFKRFYETRTF